jgi:hypothetical protein
MPWLRWWFGRLNVVVLVVVKDELSGFIVIVNSSGKVDAIGTTIAPLHDVF